LPCSAVWSAATFDPLPVARALAIERMEERCLLTTFTALQVGDIAARRTAFDQFGFPG
jgi:hypothetical protein